ncbi:MAG: GTP-binding protein [Promethearchaeota archaeon]|nr:MAG: GTP-binding protein [Candidatus Lokiarchaeota archaeon]
MATSAEKFEDSPESIRYQFKIILLGDGGVGKTCLANRFCYSEFVDTKLTIGLSFNSYSILAEENGYKLRIGLSIWDFGGQERFRPLIPQFISGANAALWVYDMNAFHSLLNLEKNWLPLLNQNSPNIPTILVGEKADIVPEEERFDLETVQEFVEKLGASRAYESSSKKGLNTTEIFKQLIKELLKEPPYNTRNITLL